MKTNRYRFVGAFAMHEIDATSDEIAQRCAAYIVGAAVKLVRYNGRYWEPIVEQTNAQ